jgi:predicted unusual protein kinase regulating ubiquinone biosynthesis (AarF/ABC1/UbiB family)
VHQATKDGKKLAVKIQYPGVADSVRADLKMVKPFAVRLMNLNERDIDKYMEEVETKLLEETDYRLELRRSREISQACAHLTGLKFSHYYPEYSSDRVLTMDWMEGRHLDEFLKTNPTQQVRDKIGQALWDFYDYQVHTLRTVHADPHPGNFLMQPDGSLGIIDFGCVKEIPKNYYVNYFTLINPDILSDEGLTEKTFFGLEFLHESDSSAERKFYVDLFREMIVLLGKPFHEEVFDFGDQAYFDGVFDYADRLTKMKELRESKVARGSKDALYINRTYYGLYAMLNQLQARVRTSSPSWIWELSKIEGR